MVLLKSRMERLGIKFEMLLLIFVREDVLSHFNILVEVWKLTVLLGLWLLAVFFAANIWILFRNKVFSIRLQLIQLVHAPKLGIEIDREIIFGSIIVSFGLSAPNSSRLRSFLASTRDSLLALSIVLHPELLHRSKLSVLFL